MSETEHRLLAAAYDPVMYVLDAVQFRPHREYLTSNLAGTVVDLGCGTGTLFKYLPRNRLRSGAIEYHAVEPDRSMRKRAVRRARRLELPMTIHDDRAESLPFENESVDVVLSSMVLCTVDNLSQSIAEIYRVLEPRGTLKFFEHVAGDGHLHRIQRRVTPLWGRLAGGCHLDRRSVTRVVSHRGFDPVKIERVRAGIPPVYPFMRGTVRCRK